MFGLMVCKEAAVINEKQFPSSIDKQWLPTTDKETHLIDYMSSSSPNINLTMSVELLGYQNLYNHENPSSLKNWEKEAWFRD